MWKAKCKQIGAMLIFGSIGLFVRALPFQSAQIALARGLIGSLFLLLCVFLLRQRLCWERIRPNLLLLILSGAAMGFNWILLFQAYRFTSIANATLCYYFAPVLVMFLSPLLFKESLTKGKVLCILAAMAGMVCVVGAGGFSLQGTNLLGICLGLSAAVLYAAVVLLNQYLKDLSGMERSLLQLAVSACALLPYVLATDGFSLQLLQGAGLPLLLFVGVVHTGAAYYLYFSSMQDLSSQTVAVFSYIDPISAILLSAVFLKEPLTPLQIFGGILILGATLVPEIGQIKAHKTNAT